MRLLPCVKFVEVMVVIFMMGPTTPQGALPVEPLSWNRFPDRAVASRVIPSASLLKFGPPSYRITAW